MSKLEWFFKNAGTIGAFWLGGTVTWFSNITVLNWRWWVIVLPVIILYGIELIYWQNKNK